MKTSDFQLKPVRPEFIPNRERDPEGYARWEMLTKYLPRWQSNSRYDLGIVRFGFELFPHTLDRKLGIAGWVKPALGQVLQYKPGMDKTDRAHAIRTYRDGSKSTWFAKILQLYLMLVGQHGIYWDNQILPLADYIRMRGKSQEKAEEKLTNITMEVGNNERILELFGDLQPSVKEVKTKKLKNQAKLLILRNNHVLQAQGLNMPSRGANIFDKRPKVDINDDVENKENTKSQQQRDYNSQEIMGEQFGGLADNGLTIYIGNMVHNDCLISHLLRPNSGWKTQDHTITKIDDNGREYADWPERFPLEKVKKLREFYAKQTKGNGLYIFNMEYYNRILSDSDYKYSRFTGKLYQKNGRNWIKVLNEDPLTKLNEPYKHYNCHVVVSGDPAIAGQSGSSLGVVSVNAFCSDGKRRLLNLGVRMYDINDRFVEPALAAHPFAMTAEELGNVYRRGMVQEMARFIFMYNADAWALETAGQQLAWYNDLVALLKEVGKGHLPGMRVNPTEEGEKKRKLQFGLMNFFSAGLYEISNDLDFFEYLKNEVDTFPASSLDVLDSIYNTEQIGMCPTPMAYDPFSVEKPDQFVSPDADLPDDVDPYMIF